jgi:hypothetical protein
MSIWDFECTFNYLPALVRTKRGNTGLMFEPGNLIQHKLGRSVVHQQYITSSFVAFKN